MNYNDISMPVSYTHLDVYKRQGHGIDPTLEGGKIYKRNKYYYIFAPAGGVPTGWQLVLRSKNILGPYERHVAIDQGSTKITVSYTHLDVYKRQCVYDGFRDT